MTATRGPQASHILPRPCLPRYPSVLALSNDGQKGKTSYNTTGNMRETAAGINGTNKEYGFDSTNTKSAARVIDSHTSDYGQQHRTYTWRETEYKDGGQVVQMDSTADGHTKERKTTATIRTDIRQTPQTIMQGATPKTLPLILAQRKRLPFSHTVVPRSIIGERMAARGYFICPKLFCSSLYFSLLRRLPTVQFTTI